MWLKMDLDGIVVSLQVKNYKKVDEANWDSTWCETDFSFISEPWLNYGKINDEIFLAGEIDNLTDLLEALLKNRITEKTEFSCVEPDFNFTLNPGHEFADIDMEWRVSLERWFDR